MRYLLLLFTVVTLLAALYLAGLYGFTPYATMQAALAAANTQSWAAISPEPLPKLAHTAARYALLRGTIGVVLSGALLSLWKLGKRRSWWEIQRLGRDITLAWRALRRFWRSLNRAEQWAAPSVLLLILGLRLWFLEQSAFNPDELVSSDYFVWPGARVTACFYALPNNHILYNLLGGFMLWLGPAGSNPELLLRLPSLGLGLLGTGVVYAVLARLTSFRVATFLVCFMQLVPDAVTYSVTARGYGLQAICIYALFLAVLVLWRGPAYHRLAWTVAVIASVLGFYLIPTFIYSFLSLGVGLFGGLVCQRRNRLQVVHILVAGAAVLLLTGFLYLPVGLLSGWPALLANPYVDRLTAAHFWTNFGPYYLWSTVGVLLGQQTVTVPALLVLISGGMVLIRRWAPAAWWPAAALAWAGLLGLLPLLVMQRVFAPPRAVHYVVFFVGLLGVLLFEAVVRRSSFPSYLAWLVMGLGLVAYAGYRMPHQTRSLMPDSALRVEAIQAYQWLRARHPRRILTDAYGYNLYLRHLALVRRQALLPIQLVAQPPLVEADDYLMQTPGHPLPDWVQPPYQLVYQHEYLLIYHLMQASSTSNKRSEAENMR